MKKIVLSIAVVLVNITICPAQELTLEVVPGELASQLAKEQKQTVTDLILTGNLNKEDFYFMRDSLPKLKNVDLKQTRVDTIPARAFYDKDINTILLPLELKYIDEDAFSTKTIWNGMQIYITGKYPQRATNIMVEFTADYPPKHLKISKNNPYCIVKEHNIILSSDGKTLYDFGKESYKYEFNEGLEIIESYALTYINGAEYTFPSSLKIIKKHAFYNWAFERTTNILHPEYYYVVMKAKNPPKLEEEAFIINNSDDVYCDLIVPDNYSEIYRNANPLWNVFHIIEESTPSSNQLTFSQNLSVIGNELNWKLSGEQIIKKVEVYDTLGHLIHSQKCNDVSVEIPITRNKSVMIIKVHYQDGKLETLKLMD